MLNDRLIKALEQRTGETYESMRETAIDVRRARVEEVKGKETTFPTYFPHIGRGNVLHDKTTSRSQVNSAVDNALLSRRSIWAIFDRRKS